MLLSFNTKLSKRFKSQSQRIRVLTESWVNNQVFCPACGCDIKHYENNKPVADFYCLNCKEEYELKSKRDSIGNKVVDGAYRTMIERLQSSCNPNFFLLSYNLRSLKVSDFFVIPKHFFVPDIIEKRNPLSASARRAGWIGCNIDLRSIPQSGKIFFVKDSRIQTKNNVLKSWVKTLFLKNEKEPLAKGWILDVMSCIDKLGKYKFSLTEIYFFEGFLRKKYPQNKHIKDKIRQQLQFLRNKGYLKFLGRGKYEIT